MAPDRSTVPASWASWTNVVLGVWLIIAPFALGYGAFPAPVWNDIVLGLLIIAAGYTATRSLTPGPSGWNVLFGVWLIAAPYLLRYSAERAATNDVVVGLAVASLGLTAVIAKTAAGGQRATGT